MSLTLFSVFSGSSDLNFDDYTNSNKVQVSDGVQTVGKKSQFAYLAGSTFTSIPSFVVFLMREWTSLNLGRGRLKQAAEMQDGEEYCRHRSR